MEPNAAQDLEILMDSPLAEVKEAAVTRGCQEQRMLIQRSTNSEIAEESSERKHAGQGTQLPTVSSLDAKGR